MTKRILYFLLTSIQVVAIWYALMKLVEKLGWEILGFLLSLPIIVTFPIGTFAVMLLVAFYGVVWFWLEPMLYLLVLRKKISY